MAYRPPRRVAELMSGSGQYADLHARWGASLA
jgi:hypothetical protein